MVAPTDSPSTGADADGGSPDRRDGIDRHESDRTLAARRRFDPGSCTHVDLEQPGSDADVQQDLDGPARRAAILAGAAHRAVELLTGNMATMRGVDASAAGAIISIETLLAQLSPKVSALDQAVNRARAEAPAAHREHYDELSRLVSLLRLEIDYSLSPRES